jgi:hypothetical protein
MQFSRAMVALFKNVVFKENDSTVWQTIIEQRYKMEDYVSKIGLTLIIDEMDGYAYLKQRIYSDGEPVVPRLIPRFPLSYPVSLLLVLLRKRLLEFDTKTGDQRLIMSRMQIAEHMRLFLKDTTNEAKLVTDIDKYIDRVEKMGFLRRLRNNDDSFEVQRILRSFINAEWLQNINEHLAVYQAYANNDKVRDGEEE